MLNTYWKWEDGTGLVSSQNLYK